MSVRQQVSSIPHSVQYFYQYKAGKVCTETKKAETNKAFNIKRCFKWSFASRSEFICTVGNFNKYKNIDFFAGKFSC